MRNCTDVMVCLRQQIDLSFPYHSFPEKAPESVRFNPLGKNYICFVIIGTNTSVEYLEI